MEVLLDDFHRGPGMYTDDIFLLADSCIEAGYFPRLVGQKFVLGMDIQGSGRAIIHRTDVSFLMSCPCRVWLLSGAIRVLLGDSHALPGGPDRRCFVEIKIVDLMEFLIRYGIFLEERLCVSDWLSEWDVVGEVEKMGVDEMLEELGQRLEDGKEAV